MSSTSLLRPLDGVERWFYYLDQNSPNHFSFVAHLANPLEAIQCREVLDKVQQRHPLLNVSIVADSNGPSFQLHSHCPIPLKTTTRSSDEDSWQEIVQKNATRPFDTRAAPLMRAEVLNTATDAHVILTIHHTIADGMGMVFIMRDFLSSLSGEQLVNLEVPTSLEHLQLAQFGAPQAADDTNNHAETAAAAPAARPLAFRKFRPDCAPAVYQLLMTEDQTQRLLDIARKHQLTVHAALTAALVIAGTRHSDRWGKLPVRVFTPTNIREPIQAGEALQVAVSGGVVQLGPVLDSCVWTVARNAFTQLKTPWLTGDGRFIVSNMVGKVAENQVGTLDFTSQNLGYEIMVTNPGRIVYQLPVGSPTVLQLHGPYVLFGYEGEQVVSAVTFNGRLSLSLTSYTPIEGLLQEAVHILMEAVTK